MYPELLYLGPVTLYSFGVMAALALITGVLLAWSLMRSRGVPFEYVFEALVVVGAGGFGGARIYYMAQHWSEVKGDFWHTLFGGAGFTWYGGFAGGFVFLLLWALARHIPIGPGANAVAVALPVGYAIGRIGCLLSGDGDYGRPSDLPWAMSFPHGVVPTPPGVRVQPTPIYETLTMLAVAAALYWLMRKPRPGWYVFGWFLVLAGCERLLVEFVRTNPMLALGLTAPQWESIVSMGAGVALILAVRRRAAGPPPSAWSGM